MYGIPEDLDLAGIVGHTTTQIRVGQYDIQFTFGKFSFMAESTVFLINLGQEVGRWEKGSWPPSAFFNAMNVEVTEWFVRDSRTLVIRLENGYEIHLCDDSDQFETIQIWEDGNASPWII